MHGEHTAAQQRLHVLSGIQWSLGRRKKNRLVGEASGKFPRDCTARFIAAWQV
jgi:hypothetical protein